MRTFNFNSLMELTVLLQESEVSKFTDGGQEPDVIFSGLSLSGYVIPLEGMIIGILLFLGVYAILEHYIRLLPQERYRLATTMIRQIYAPLVLLRNRLEEIVESGASKETCRMLEPVLEYTERIIISHQNIMQLDRVNWKAASKDRITEVEIHNYIRMATGQCQSYANSHHVRLVISHSEGYADCKINEGFMTVALQHLLNKMIDITATGGCIYITVSNNTGYWKLQTTNCTKTKGKSPMWILPMPVPGVFRTTEKIIRLHGGKMTACRYGKTAVCQIVMPMDCLCRKTMILSSHIFLHKHTKNKKEEDMDAGKKEVTSTTKNLPRVLLIMTDNMFGNYLHAALSGEFNILLQENLDIPELISTKEKPDVIIIDENVNGTCGDELCSRIKAEKMTLAIPVILLIEYGGSRDYLSHAGSRADRLELRTIGTCRLRVDIHMLISSCTILRKGANRLLADTIHAFPQVVGKEDDNFLFISKVRKLIEENLVTQGYTIESLCTGMGMSRTRFYNKMKEVTKKHPMEYVSTFKMERAKELLASGRYSVTEVADMLGYCDAKYFGKKFKSIYHVCPTKFIKEG